MQGGFRARPRAQRAYATGASALAQARRPSCSDRTAVSTLSMREMWEHDEFLSALHQRVLSALLIWFAVGESVVCVLVVLQSYGHAVATRSLVTAEAAVPVLVGFALVHHRTTQGADRGTGLGLAMVRVAAVDAYGFIEIESTPGVGTTFRICLPRFEGPGRTPGAARG